MIVAHVLIINDLKRAIKSILYFYSIIMLIEYVLFVVDISCFLYVFKIILLPKNMTVNILHTYILYTFCVLF